MNKPIRPIETWYAGCRFRSRLEARYAVLFDHLGIRWEYEPQGYLVGPNHDLPYLPDFWLPAERLWVEVKGSEDQLDLERLIYAAIPQYGLPAGSPPFVLGDYQVRMLILGPIRRGVGRITDNATNEHVGYMQPAPTVLSFRKGDLFQGSAWFINKGIQVSPEGGLVANDSPEIFLGTRGAEWGNFVGGGGAIGDEYDEAVAAAYVAAKSARFEHGERG